MKQFTFTMLVILLACCSLSTKAQRYNTKFFTGGFGLEGGLPWGSFVKGMKGSMGLDLRFAFKGGPGYITLSGGLTGFGGTSNPKGGYDSGYFSGGIAPVLKIGYKYFIARHFFVMADGGFDKYYLNQGNGEGRSRNINGLGFTFCPSLGAQFGVFEMAVRYEAFSVPHGGISNANLRLGIDF